MKEGMIEGRKREKGGDEMTELGKEGLTWGMKEGMIKGEREEMK